MDVQTSGKRFFLIMGVVLLAIVIAGFAPSALMQPGGLSGLPVILHVHGVLFFLWYVLFCAQAWLAGNGRIEQHKNLGYTSMVLAFCMFIAAYLVMQHAYANPDFSIMGMSATSSLIFPFTDIVNFWIVYLLGVAQRPYPEIHKRFMLLAGIVMIDPAMSRLVFTVGGPGPLIVVAELALFAAIIVYDIRTRGRPMWPTMTGLGLYIAAMVAKLAFAESPGWIDLAGQLFGPVS